MNDATEIDYKCPLCKVENHTSLRISVEAEDKETVQRLIQGTLFERQCIGCKVTTSFDYSFRYLNHKANFCLWNTPANDPFESKFADDQIPSPDYTLRRTTDINALRELLLVQLAGLDDGAMLLMKHMLAYKVREDSGTAPLLCGFDAIYSEDGNHWLEYVIFKDEESDPDALHVPIKVYEDLSESIQPLRQEFMPMGVWVDWNEMTAAKMWQRLTEKAGTVI